MIFDSGSINEGHVFTAIGAVGAALVLFGFYRTSIGRWTNKTLWYELDNIVGSILLIIYSVHFGAFISIIVNSVWLIVSFRGLRPFAERYSKRLRRKVTRSIAAKRRMQRRARAAPRATES